MPDNVAPRRRKAPRPKQKPKGVAVIVGSKRSINKIEPDPTRTLEADTDALGHVAPGMTIHVTEDYAEELTGYGLAHYEGTEE